MKTLSPTMQDASLEHPYILDRRPTVTSQLSHIVLCYTGQNNIEPWVTWYENPDGDYGAGHYYVHRSGADWDFDHRQ